MKEYYKQIKVLTAFALVAFAVLLIFACFSQRGKITVKNKPAKAVTSALSEEAAQEQINKKVSPITEAEVSEKSSYNSNTSEPFNDFPVNINTADAKTLMNIPGIGQAKANEIVAYRNANGNFSRAEDLLNVYGISEATLAKIYGYITV